MPKVSRSLPPSRNSVYAPHRLAPPRKYSKSGCPCPAAPHSQKLYFLQFIKALPLYTLIITSLYSIFVRRTENDTRKIATAVKYCLSSAKKAVDIIIIITAINVPTRISKKIEKISAHFSCVFVWGGGRRL